MCTAILSVDPDADVQVCLVGVRDEFTGRPWEPPARHWADRPELVGGLDLQAGGTWLAVNTVTPAAACVLNGRGRAAPEDGRRSRGELPLLLAGEGDLDAGTLETFDPFHAIRADLSDVVMWSWDGLELTRAVLGPGLHMVVNSGLEPTAELVARLEYFRPRFLAAARPFSDARTAWEPWLELVDGDHLDPGDPRALILRREIGDGHVWASTSVSLVALSRDGVRFDFSGRPGHGTFIPVDVRA